MAKQKRNKMGLYIVGGLVIAGGIFYFWQQQQQARNRQIILEAMRQRNVPPAPINNTPQAISAWVNTIFSIYGNAKQLWEPGGPFYKVPKDAQTILDAMAKYPGFFIP